MPTPTARVNSLIDALVNHNANAPLRARVLAAYALLAPPGSTDTQIATIMLAELRRKMIDQIKFKEGGAASAATIAQVDADFAESP